MVQLRRQDARARSVAKGSDQIGRNYMRHNNATVLAMSTAPNPTHFQKTLGCTAKALSRWLQWFPEQPFDWIAQHSIDFWLTSEDLPLAQNRIHYRDGSVHLDLTATNMEGNRRLHHKLEQVCSRSTSSPA